MIKLRRQQQIGLLAIALILFIIYILYMAGVRRKSSTQSDDSNISQSTDTSGEPEVNNNSASLTTNYSPADGQSKGNIRIKNTGQLKNLPESEIAEIQAALYSTLSDNVDDAVSVSDVEIRDQSISQSYDSDSHKYTTSFLIDIPSLKQTYQAKDVYSLIPANQPKDYNPLVLCPTSDQLKWASFTCTDRIKQEVK